MKRFFLIFLLIQPNIGVAQIPSPDDLGGMIDWFKVAEAAASSPPSVPQNLTSSEALVQSGYVVGLLVGTINMGRVNRLVCFSEEMQMPELSSLIRNVRLILEMAEIQRQQGDEVPAVVMVAAAVQTLYSCQK